MFKKSLCTLTTVLQSAGAQILFDHTKYIYIYIYIYIKLKTSYSIYSAVPPFFFFKRAPISPVGKTPTQQANTVTRSRDHCSSGTQQYVPCAVEPHVTASCTQYFVSHKNIFMAKLCR